MFPDILFDGFEGIIQITLAAPTLYIAIIAFIRLTGKRSTSQMNNFDWVVTVAMGSIAGSGIVVEDVSVTEALYAIGLLLCIQWLLTRLIFRNETVAQIVKARPALLVDRGQYIHETMRSERVTETEVNSAIRENGITDIDKVQWVILEPDATMSVIPVPRDSELETSAVQDVQGLPREFQN